MIGYSTGVWWIDLLAAWGFIFLGLMVLGIPAWMAVSKLWWRKRDAAEEERLLAPLTVEPAKTGADK